MSTDGECILQNQALSLAQKIRPLLNFIKARGLKSLLACINDLWLYNYHNQTYDGTALSIFETIQFVQEKQWEISGLDEAKETVETSIEQIDLYNPQSNQKYLEKERKNNLFIASTMDFFVFHVPLMLVLVFLLNRLFYCLFNFTISSLIRPYCFWWIIFEMLIQSNI